MYKILLCLRYLRTRWIALASIVSVTLGVATLIVVNSVMGGFATEMRDRLKGVLADVMIDARSHNGFANPELYMKQIEQRLGDRIEAMTPVVETLGMLVFNYGSENITVGVNVRGVDPETYGRVGKFTEYLVDPRNRREPSFLIREDIRRAMEPWRDWDWADTGPAPDRREPAGDAGPFAHSLMEADSDSPLRAGVEPDGPATDPNPVGRRLHPLHPFEQQRDEPVLGFSPETEAPDRGIIVPWLATTTRFQGRDIELIKPGGQVLLLLPSASVGTMKVEGRYSQFTVVDRFKSGMSEYDQVHCYVHIRDLQEIRGMPNRVNSIEIRLKNYADVPIVVAELERIFRPGMFSVRTWEQKQSPLLSAVQVEQGILNVLLFLIIAVAGFGILAIFFMIVVEKTRDIGILKSLGASDSGVMQIFLGYGMCLGAVGSGLGLVIGLGIVVYLDRIENALSWLMGQDIFDRDLYYFDKIPTLIDWVSIGWIVGGAMVIAIAASVLPARRAAALKPVEALRYW